MFRFFLQRLAASLLLLFLVLSSTFFFIHLAPGEPGRLFEDPRISENARQDMRRAYGLDQPIGERYFRWLGAALRGDWGTSFSVGRPAAQVLLEMLPNTVLLILAASLIEYFLGLVFGMAAAASPNSRWDHLIRIGSLTLIAVPIFWLALLLLEIFAVRWPLFPTGQMNSGTLGLTAFQQTLETLHHLVLPAVTIAVARCGVVVRFVRNGLLEVLGQDYIRTAYAKGLSHQRVLWRHALRNSLIPLVQRFGTSLPQLLSGTVIIEVIFSWPGIGSAIFAAVLQRDYPVILASTALSGTFVICGSLIADLIHGWLDPRVRHA